MDSIAREELEWRANHGGRNQRAQVQEQLLSFSHGNSAPVPASCPAGANPDRNVTATSSNVFDSDVAKDIVMQWAWGLTSANKVQQLAANSKSDMEAMLHEMGASRDFIPSSLVALAKIGDSGRYEANAHRDLLLYLGEPAMPKAFKTLVHVKVIKPKKNNTAVQAVRCSLLLPHEVFSYYYHHRRDEFVRKFFGGDQTNIKKFWEGVVSGRDPRIKGHAMATEHPQWHGKGVPLSIHGDAVPCLAVGKSGTKSLDVISWQPLLAMSGSSLDLKLYIYIHIYIRQPLLARSAWL